MMRLNEIEANPVAHIVEYISQHGLKEYPNSPREVSFIDNTETKLLVSDLQEKLQSLGFRELTDLGPSSDDMVGQEWGRSLRPHEEKEARVSLDSKGGEFVRFVYLKTEPSRDRAVGSSVVGRATPE